MQNQIARICPTGMKCIHDMINRGMIQSLSIPQKKVGAGRVVQARRSPDLQLQESWSYGYLPKIFEVMSSIMDKPHSFYCGFDPTAKSLHLGHMTVLSVMLNLVRHGHRVILLVGGATAQLGDPVGKKEDRVITANNILNENAVAIEKQLTQIFTQYCSRYNISCDNFSVVNNREWYRSQTLKEFMELVGSEFKITDMADRLVVRSRLEGENSDMRFSEFVYPTFQSYDWYELYKRYTCAIQIGGQDQIGNIEDGYSYMWKKLDKKPPLAGITVPLMTTEKGEKLGKTSSNAVWLDQSMAGSQSLLQYLELLSEKDMMSLAHKLTAHPTEELQKTSRTELVAAVSEELLPLIT